MQEFVKDYKFILWFLILSLSIATFTGQKFLFYFLLLVLSSMVILNANEIQQRLGGMFS